MSKEKTNTTTATAPATAPATNGKAPKAEKVAKVKVTLTPEQKAERKEAFLAKRAKTMELKAKISDMQGALKGFIELADANRAIAPDFAAKMDEQVGLYTQKIIDFKAQLGATRKSMTARYVEFFTRRITKEMARKVKVDGVDTDQSEKVLAEAKSLLKDFFASLKNTDTV